MSSQVRMTVYAALATMATATTLTAVFSGSGWIVPVYVGIILVALSCALVRASPLPSAFEPITAAVAVLCWVTALYARAEAHLGFIPGRTAFRHLSRVAQHGFDEIHRQPAPVPAHHGLVMLTVVGVAAVALVVDLMVVTLRRAALAGLPLLALFTICAATGKHGVSVIWFIVAAVGYLALLYADNREKVSRWGAAVGTGSRARPASAWSTDPSAGPAPASLGRRVGAMAITLGVLVPFVIPGLHTGIDKHGAGAGSGSGGTLTIDNPLVSVTSELQEQSHTPLFEYTTSAGKNLRYLRLTSLDQFNGTTFSGRSLTAQGSPDASSDLPVTYPPTRGTDVSYSFVVSAKLASHLLPLPTTALGVNVSDPWRYDPDSSTVFSPDHAVSTQGRNYESFSNPAEPTPQELAAVTPSMPSAALSQDLHAPVSHAVRALALHVTAHAGNNPYRKAVAIEQFFRDEKNGFTYNLHPKPYAGPDALGHFLRVSRQGFCQQYATAMAVMARVNDIPSRVAVGFTPGTRQNGLWHVTSDDAHAWPELYFNGYGWLAFEPTPRGDGQTIVPSYATTDVSKGSSTHHPKPASGSTTPSRRPRPLTGSGGVTSTGASSGHGSADLAGILLAVLLLLAVAAPGVGRAITRRRRNRLMTDPTRGNAAAWAELRDTAIDARAPWDDGHTPRQLAATLGASVGGHDDAREALSRLAYQEERSRYARSSSPAGADPQRDVAIVREALLAQRSRWQRVTATILPRSTTAIGRAYLTRVTAAKDRMVRSLGHLRHRARLRSS